MIEVVNYAEASEEPVFLKHTDVSWGLSDITFTAHGIFVLFGDEYVHQSRKVKGYELALTFQSAGGSLWASEGTETGGCE